MKVGIKQLDVNMDLKRKGMELSVYNGDDTHLGDLFINQAQVTWCSGRSTPWSGGIKMSWNEFIHAMEEWGSNNHK